ncbi:hypothetical protein MIR68_007140 [Amoeboaphelidium protococcarum]|nr:hypothetical protein MIR68_007140 [Amoeboaphelidium protococcarum]
MSTQIDSTEVPQAPLYERVAQVGEGTYGKVYKAKDRDGQYVALKRIRLETEKEGFPVTAMREIKLLQKFDHPNILSLREMLSSRDGVFMVIDYMKYDLTGLLQGSGIKFSVPQIKCTMKQILSGLEYLHAQGILHRDIKSSNILIDHEGIVKLADFGLARVTNRYGLPRRDAEDADGVVLQSPVGYTNRVITLWYRPPELLLGAVEYDSSVDMFGAGTLLLELYLGKQPFQGSDDIDQLEVLYKALGSPDADAHVYFKSLPWYYLVSPQQTYTTKFHQLFVETKIIDQSAADLILSMLRYLPKERISAANALQSEYFTSEPLPCLLSELPKPDEDLHEFEVKQKRKRDASTTSSKP